MQRHSEGCRAFAKPIRGFPIAVILGISFGFALVAQAKSAYRGDYNRPSHRVGTSEASISGQNGSMNVNGDEVELHDGIVTVNGIPYGAVPQGAAVRYVVSGDHKALYVNGKLRQPLAAGNR